MLGHLNKELPLVVVANIAESSIDFLPRNLKITSELVRVRQFKAERALLWSGMQKLVFVSHPVPHRRYLQGHLGYAKTIFVAPETPTACLSQDIVREQYLLNQIVAYAGDARTIQLIPYATTRQFLGLADILREKYGLTVYLPESVTPDNLWLCQYLGSKSGFRTQVARWLPVDRLPPATICRNPQMASDVLRWLSVQGKACVIKPDRGQAGIGMGICGNGHHPVEQAIKALESNPFLAEGYITVEEYIRSSRKLSPSLEFYVPPLGQGEPEIAYLSNQLFTEEVGHFNGVLLSREMVDASWLPGFEKDGLTIAANLQKMGYVGYFDLDAVVDDDENLYLLELNARRTGGTHVHEFAAFAFGEHYLDQVTLRSQDAMPSGKVRDLDALLARVDNLLYPMRGNPRGVVVTISSTLPAGRFGCIIVASDEDEAATLESDLARQLAEQ